MSKSRNLANLLSGGVPAFSGTSAIDVPAGTTAQRPANPNTGYVRFNTTSDNLEQYTSSGWKAISAPPSVTSLDVNEIAGDAAGTTDIGIVGTNFASGATVKAIGADGSSFFANTVVVNSSTSITATFTNSSFSNANEPYSIQVINISGLTGIIADQINVDSSPVWNTASGSLGTVFEGQSVNFTPSATDPDGDTITYSETASVLSGSGLSLNSATGAITGTAPLVSGDTTKSFTLRATANAKNSDRAFSILIKDAIGTSTNPATSATQLYNAGYTTDGAYYISNKFTNNTAVSVYCRFNVIDSLNSQPLHLQRLELPFLPGYAARNYFNCGSGGITRHYNNEQNSQVTTGAGLTYTSVSSSCGTSSIVDTGLRLSDFAGWTLVQEMNVTSTGDNANTLGVHLALSNSSNGGDYGHSYHGTYVVMNMLSGQSGVYLAAVPIIDYGTYAGFKRNDTTYGYFKDGTNSTVWSEMYNGTNATQFNDANFLTTNTTEYSQYVGFRFRGWSDNSNPITAQYVFWIGENGS